MNRNAQLINERYDALMFAKTPESARRAAHELVRVVLGEDAVARPLEETLREVCRHLRPSDNTSEQARFENEFVELGIWPNSAQRIAA